MGVVLGGRQVQMPLLFEEEKRSLRRWLFVCLKREEKKRLLKSQDVEAAG